MATNRRAFLDQLLKSIAVLTAAAGKGATMARAQDAVSSRRHLVAIFPEGAAGYDTESFHMGLNPALLAQAGVPLITGQVGDPGDMHTPRSYGGNEGFVHPKYTSSDPSAYLGPGMSIFKGTGLLENEIAIWGGLRSEDGGHHVANQVFNCGNRSRYAASFSSLVAAQLGMTNPRPLHYVQIANAGQLETHSGLVGGMGEAVNIPTLASLQAITAPVAGAPTENRRKMIEAAMKELTETAVRNRLKLKANQEFYSAYHEGYKGMTWLANSKIAAAGSPLQLLIAQYMADISATVKGHEYWARFTASSARNYDFSTIAYRFALCEFLIKENLSAVVDFAGMFIDAHGDNDYECIGLLATYAGIKLLLTHLKAIPLPGGGGKSLLDVTTLAMFTEFDRWPTRSWVSVENQALNQPLGVAHGMTSSVFLAGAGIAGGRVVGGLKHAKTGEGGFEGAVASGLPVDADGRPKASGSYLYIEDLFPTMMKIFGVTIPAQQITAHSAIEALIRKA